jgi:hypothetical protein
VDELKCNYPETARLHDANEQTTGLPLPQEVCVSQAYTDDRAGGEI